LRSAGQRAILRPFRGEPRITRRELTAALDGRVIRREDDMRLLKMLIGAALALPLMLTAALAQQPLKIRIAWTVPVANSPTILYQIPENLKFKGKSYDIELIYFQGTPLMITALQANEVDIALLAYSTLALAVQNAGMNDLRVIADEAQEGVEGYYTSPFLVRKDSGINKVEDMKGKVAATVAAGAAVDIAMRAMLKKHGLEDKRDYSVVEAAFPNMRALLQEKKADLVSSVLPFSIDPQMLDVAKTLFTVKDAIGRSEFIVWVARDGFLSKNKAAMTDFMEDSSRSLHFLMDPKNRDKLMEIASRVGKRPASAYSSWMYTKNDLYRDPDLIPDLDALQRSVDVQQSLGFLKDKIDIKKYADLSFVQEAKKRMK
jgi:NitT/TauT family transport system substrate-binding protein